MITQYQCQIVYDTFFFQWFQKNITEKFNNIFFKYICHWIIITKNKIFFFNTKMDLVLLLFGEFNEKYNPLIKD